MLPHENQSVALRAISARQQRLVENHLPLVSLTLRRCESLARGSGLGRDRAELVQEGCLALIDAVRTHDPTRHGDFAAFAMARIHYAMSRFAHEHASPIRVPFITQRRNKDRRRQADGDGRRPDELPRVVQMPDDVEDGGRQATPRHAPGRSEAGSSDRTVGDMVRQCYDKAVGKVATEMKGSRRCSPGVAEMVDRCLEERWRIPEPLERTSVRQVAEALRCTTSRVAHCEERFRRKVAGLLSDDPTYRDLVRIARQRADGWRHRLTESEVASLRAHGAHHASP